jgi:hypothetical protein
MSMPDEEVTPTQPPAVIVPAVAPTECKICHRVMDGNRCPVDGWQIVDDP